MIISPLAISSIKCGSLFTSCTCMVKQIINVRMPSAIHHWVLIFLFVFQGCQGLFLRHAETEKCIRTSEELAYNGPNHALPYYVVMDDNCLNDKAQFRYLDSELLENIEKEGTLVSSKSKTYKGRWAVYKGVAKRAKKFQSDAENRLKQTAGGSLLFYHKKGPECAEPSSKYIMRKIYCNTTKQKFTFGSVAAYSAKMENVHCSPIQLMVVESADYGDFDDSGTFNKNANIDTQCSQLTNCQVKSLCGGQRSCELTMDNNLLPSKYCSDTSKQIYTKYTCVDTYSSSAITTASNIRLTNQNEGYIEIKDGSIWRKVVEENWDRKRQKMLCQHLGFEKSNDNSIETRQLRSGEKIVIGDVICYNTQSSGTSCCVHLEPSVSTFNTTIPYVTCKIRCKNPLLHDANAFPDSAFSGSGDSSDNYKDARITKGGWCPSGSGSAYLLINLQKEYHITGVVVMADKEQTKWSGSYSLLYFQDSAYRKIFGNQNGYQASKTNFNIYNARYVKIKSTGNQDFCLRIELCGEVQTPAPVSSINVLPSSYSARVSWEISASTLDSSYITEIIIYLSNIKQKTISRGTQSNIYGLQPYTWYTVGIQTQDGSSQKSEIVYTTFTTKRAEPINLLSTSYYTLGLSIPKPEDYIRKVMVIIQNSNSSSTPRETIRTSDLTPFKENIKGPYVTAYLNARVLPLTFVIGDGKEYNSKEEKYFNRPLKQNSSYIVFLRFYENQHSYYSTKWSDNVKTMEQVPVKSGNSPNSKESDGEKFKIDLLIPLSIFVLCFLLSLAVNIYQRRLILQNSRQLQCYQEERLDSPSSNKTTESVVKTVAERFLDGDHTYESPDKIVGIVTKENSSPYMALNDKRESDNCYQSLQPPSVTADFQNEKEGDNHTMQYEMQHIT